MTGSVISIVALGTGINAMHAVQVKQSPFGTLIAGGTFMGALIFVGEHVDHRLATTLAALFLLSSLLFHGAGVINLVVALTGGKPDMAAPGVTPERNTQSA